MRWRTMPAIWEKAVRKLRGRLMPPPGAKQPEQKEIDSLMGYLETKLDTNTTLPKAGYVGVQRMSRTEYIAAVKALVGVDVKSKDILPQDTTILRFRQHRLRVGCFSGIRRAVCRGGARDREAGRRRH